ncbi:MAG: hypothetical protein KF861_18460 [Planctomycetaceae bacterium]|nr:hypothetical protein [Planctomycetaceae bacterium]
MPRSPAVFVMQTPQRYDAPVLSIAQPEWGRAMILAEIQQATYTVTQSGIGLGSAIAVVCSWQRNRSILWAIIAGLLTWFYVIYFAVTRRPDEIR